MRKMEIIFALIFVILAGVGFAEAARLGFGYERRGPQAGFIIFWLAVIILIGAGLILWRGLTMKEVKAFFLGRQAMIEAGYVALLTAVFCALMARLGTYIAIVLYCLVFTAWLGKCRWYSVIALTVIMPLAIYFGFEEGLMFPLFKSPWYARGLLPF